VTKRIAVALAGAFVVLAVSAYVALRLSPWPAALLVRFLFDAGSERTARALAKHVPKNVSSRRDLRYDASDGDAYLDVFYPSALTEGESLATILWMHGGGFVSGNKNQIANYAKILAGRGYTVVGIDYGIAPQTTYPVPVREGAAAIAYLQRHARELHVDPTRFVLAGDSAGAVLAAQLANAISVPAYARSLRIVAPIPRSHLRALVLYCGPYDAKAFGGGGPLAGLLDAILWSYSGTRNYAHDPLFATASVIDFVTSDFPPAFVSAGNADPLEPQSRAFAAALSAKGVRTDTLFFKPDHDPMLPHEYQFDLDSAGGRMALERSLGFLSTETNDARAPGDAER
jgi:acetyl esterase/lipase